MTLADLTALLSRYAAGALPLAALHAQLAPVLAADPLDVEASDPSRWEDGHDEERLFWRLIYLLEREAEDSERLRREAARVVRCLGSTGSAADTFELLPLLLDQERLTTIVARHRAGIISRTGFLNVVAESGYPAHVKLWLEHASADALATLAERLERGEYDAAVRAFERAPDSSG